MAASPSSSHPAHLDPSELGTKEYWDQYYQNDLDNDSDEEDRPDPSELESWFDDVGAPARTLEFLTSEGFELSPNHVETQGSEPRPPPSSAASASVLDLGTGNGSALFALRLQGGYRGRMVGVDYSRQSVELARKLASQYQTDVEFYVSDLIHDDPHEQPWWPADTPTAAASGDGLRGGGFDLVLDKGTFDAISLSSATVDVEAGGQRLTKRICELYPAKVLGLVKPGGFLLVTSCNWTEQEVIAWFTAGLEQHDAKFEVCHTIKYPVFEFGGQKGQGVASVCFRKTRST